MKLLRCIFSIFLLLFLCNIFLTAEKINNKIGENKKLAVLGVGFDMYNRGYETNIYLGGTFSIVKGNNIISSRIVSKLEDPAHLIECNIIESITDFGILYGKAFRFKRGADGFTSFAAGLSLTRSIKRGEVISYEEGWEKDTRYTIGIPLEFQLVIRILGPLGFGVYGLANINNIESYYGGIFSLRFANFTKKRNIITINEFYKNKKYILEFDLLRFFHFASYDNLAINGCISFPNLVKNWEIAFPIYFRYNINYKITGKLKQMLFVNLQLRKFLSAKKEGFYYNFGIQYFNIIDEFYNDLYSAETSYKAKGYWGILAGFGHRFFFSQNFYYCTNFSITKPISGDIECLNNFFTSSPSGEKFVYDVEILNIGIVF